MISLCASLEGKKLCNSKQSCGMAAAKVTANFYQSWPEPEKGLLYKQDLLRNKPSLPELGSLQN